MAVSSRRTRSIRKIALLILASCLAAAATEIPAGTHALLRVENYITTQDAEPGDYIYLRTVSPISANGSVVVPIGSHLQGVVTHAQRARRAKREGVLTIRLETLTLPDGWVLELSPPFEFQAETMAEPEVATGKHVSRVAVGASLGSSLGFVASRDFTGFGVGAGVGGAVSLATVLLRRGPEVVLYQGALPLGQLVFQPMSLPRRLVLILAQQVTHVVGLHLADVLVEQAHLQGPFPQQAPNLRIGQRANVVKPTSWSACLPLLLTIPRSPTNANSSTPN